MGGGKHGRPPATRGSVGRSRLMVSDAEQHRHHRPTRVAIVGGGPGGLFTAWHLERLAATPMAITLFEAGGRLGGKVLTPSFHTAPVRYEAGAAELYDYSPIDDDPLRHLVRSLGLPTVAMGGGAVQFGDRRIANLDDVDDLLGTDARQALAEFDTWARSAMSPREFYDSGSDHAATVLGARFHDTLDRIGSPAVRRLVETTIHSDLATEPGLTSAGYGLQNYLMNDPAYMRLYCIAGGNERLVAAIADRLTAEVRLESPVTAVVGCDDGRLDVVIGGGDGPGRESFDALILALPMDALKHIEFHGESLADAMRRHVEHHDHPAHYLRITMLFDRPLPAAGGDESFLMLDAFGGCCLYLESSREPEATHGVLGWLVAGGSAAELAAWSDDALEAAALATLPAPFESLRGSLLETRVHRWQAAVSGLPGGWKPLPLQWRHRPAAGSHPRLFVVGDYLYDTTLNGVLDGAEHVAGWVVADVGVLGKGPT